MSSPGAPPELSEHSGFLRGTPLPARLAAGVGRVLLLGLLAGCGAGADPGEPAQTADGAAPLERTPGPAGNAGIDDAGTTLDEAEQWVTGSSRMEHRPVGSVLVTGSRAARHDNFDRFVITFAGDSLPTYSVELTTGPAVQCGSGESVDLPGEAIVLVRLEPAQAHDDAGNSTLEPRDTATGFPALLEARLLCDFEGHVEWAFGITDATAFRVLELTDPTRLAVDIQH